MKRKNLALIPIALSLTLSCAEYIEEPQQGQTQQQEETTPSVTTEIINLNLENAVVPQVEDIVAAVKKTLYI